MGRRPFTTRIEGNTLDYKVSPGTLMVSNNGMKREFWKEQYYFQKAEDNTEERELRRVRLKKLRLIMADMKKVIRKVIVRQ